MDPTGCDGTVQAALTELYNGEHFGDERPPVAVLPSGKTNLFAIDLSGNFSRVTRLIVMPDRLFEPKSKHKKVAKKKVAAKKKASGTKTPPKKKTN